MKAVVWKKISQYYSFMANYVQYLARRRFFYTLINVEIAKDMARRRFFYKLIKVEIA